MKRTVSIILFTVLFFSALCSVIGWPSLVFAETETTIKIGDHFYADGTSDKPYLMRQDITVDELTI